MKVSTFRHTGLFIAAGFLAAYSWYASHASPTGDRVSLTGTVRSTKGEPLAAIPVQADLQGTNMTVVVYTNRSGQYTFKELPTGSHTLRIKVQGFEAVKKDAVTVPSLKDQGPELMLQPSAPSIDAMTSSELVMALPGNEEQKADLVQCSNCHSLQFAMHTRRDQAGWMKVIEWMRTISPSGATQPPPHFSYLLN